MEYADDPERSEELGWGESAVFSEHPEERAHRPSKLGIPLFRQGALSYRILTPALRRLTERALIDGLRTPDLRPSAREWEEALACAMDELWSCRRCQQHFPYPYWLAPVERRACPFCGERILSPYPLVLELYEERQRHSYFAIGRRLVLGNQFKIFADALDPCRKPPLTRKAEPVVGHVEWDVQRHAYHLVNDEGDQWAARPTEGSQRVAVAKGQSLLAAKGCMIHFGDERRLAIVVE